MGFVEVKVIRGWCSLPRGIGHEDRVLSDPAIKDRLNRLMIDVRNGPRANLAVPLNERDHGRLARRAASRIQFLASVLVLFPTAHVSLVVQWSGHRLIQACMSAVSRAVRARHSALCCVIATEHRRWLSRPAEPKILRCRFATDLDCHQGARQECRVP